jgi:hypothetical protein
MQTGRAAVALVLLFCGTAAAPVARQQPPPVIRGSTDAIVRTISQQTAAGKAVRSAADPD